MAKASRAKKTRTDSALAAVRPRAASRPAGDALLRESEDRFRAIVNSANEGILVYDRDLNVASGNLAAERIIGLPLAELIGKPGFTSLFPCVRADGSPLPPEERPTRLTMRTGQAQNGLVIGISRADGSVTWLKVNTAFLRRPGEIDFYGVVSTIGDITEQRRAEAALRESEQRFRQTFELAGSGIAHIDMEQRFVRANRSLCEMLGYTEAELVGRSAKEISHPEDRDVTDAQRERMRAGGMKAFSLQKRYLHKDGRVVWVELTATVVRDAAGHPLHDIAIFDDITEQKRLDEALKEKNELLQLGQSAANMIILDYDVRRDEMTWSDSPEWLRGPLPAAGKYPLFKDQVHPDDREDFLTARNHSIATLMPRSVEFRVVRTDGQVLWVLARQKVLVNADGRAARMLVAMIDITERKQVEAAVQASEERFRSLTGLSSDWYWEQDEDYRLKFMSGRVGGGLDPKTYIGTQRWDRPAANLTDEDWARHRAQLERHESFRDFEMLRTGDGGKKIWVSLSGEPVFDATGRFTGYRGVGSNITERKEAEAELRRAHDELARSNSELEQFAYVASHDLQEPLRMVSSYTQLLTRRYGDKLDGDAKEFMAYIVDGATRMKQLIEDLLAYSRVGTRGKEMMHVPLDAALRRALTNVRAAVEESGASVTYENLPTVNGDEMQLAQLFQNLLGNALKFRSQSVPRIAIGAKRAGDDWEVEVRDNGIGIEPQYFERIFMVFQRLHTKGDYPGTGIGLAICKKVVERHGGRIWVSSVPGEGTTFHFTLPRIREDS